MRPILESPTERVLSIFAPVPGHGLRASMSHPEDPGTLLGNPVAYDEFNYLASLWGNWIAPWTPWDDELRPGLTRVRWESILL